MTDNTEEFYDVTTPEGMEAFKEQAHTSFEAFSGVTYDSEKGTVALDPETQAQILMDIHSTRRKLEQLANVLGMLKYMVKAHVDDPPMDLRKALYLADQIIGEPEHVDLSFVPDIPTNLEGWDC